MMAPRLLGLSYTTMREIAALTRSIGLNASVDLLGEEGDHASPFATWQ